MELKTHLKFNPKFGRILEITEEYAKVLLETNPEMAIDKEGLVHTGFIFSAADFCAMATINEDFVILAKANNCEFMAPIKAGDVIEFKSEIIMKDKRKVEIKVVGTIEEIKVFEGFFSCVVLEEHPLKRHKWKIVKKEEENKKN